MATGYPVLRGHRRGQARRRAATSRCASRRAGRAIPPRSLRPSGKIRTALGWKPEHDDLDDIVRHALDWEERLARAGASIP